MPTYIGFSTVNANKPRTTFIQPGIDGGTGSITQPIQIGRKFRLTDLPLVVQDFINALNIHKGMKVGQPGYGTTIWSFAFQPNSVETQTMLKNEIIRVAGLDPRLTLNDVKLFTQEHGILVEVEVAVAPLNDPDVIKIFFNGQTNSAKLVG